MNESKASTPNQLSRAGEVAVAPKLHHIALKTNQFNKMCDFYRSLLNFRPTLEVEQVVGFYTFDLTHHRLVIFNDPSLSSEVPPSKGMHHVAFAYDTVDDLMCVYERLKDKSILPFIAVNHGPNTAYYYHDPDNNIIELEIDNFESDLQKGLDFMSEIQLNPAILFSKPEVMFMPINPETYLTAWQAGATQAELHERSYAGEFIEGAQDQPLPPGFDPRRV